MGHYDDAISDDSYDNCAEHEASADAYDDADHKVTMPLLLVDNVDAIRFEEAQVCVPPVPTRREAIPINRNRIVNRAV